MKILFFTIILLSTNIVGATAIPTDGDSIIHKKINTDIKRIMNNYSIEKQAAEDTLPSTKSNEKRIAKLGEAFILKSKQCVNIEDEIEVELTMHMQEWGYTGPPEDENRKWFGGDIYMLTVKTKNGIETLLDFYESEQLENISTVKIENYTIDLLSSDYSAGEIELVVTKK